jgi:sulfite reductase alpha subunit-like flavoprotein
MASSIANRRPLLLYASQYGTSCSLAFRLSRDLFLHHFTPVVLSISSYPISQLPNEEFVIFLCSTSGHGEVPDSMRAFWRFLLRKDLPSNSLTSMQFTVFGLGDSSYPLFNAAARRLHQRLLDLGGRAFYPRVLCDEQAEFGLEGDFQSWKPEVIKACKTLANCQQQELKREQTHDYLIEINSDSELSPVSPLSFSSFPSSFSLLPSCVTSSTRLSSSEHFQEIRLIQFQFSSPSSSLSLIYSPGWVANVRIANDSALIQRFLTQRLALSSDSIISITRITNPVFDSLPPEFQVSSSQKYLPSHCSLFQLFTYYLDIQGVPKRDFFESIKLYTNNEREIEKLEEFLSPAGSRDLYQYCEREKRSFIEVLEDFRHVNLPLQELIQLIPPLLPRSFSIASASINHSDSSTPLSKNSLEIALAALEFQTPLKRKRIGIGSKFLCSLTQGAPVLLSLSPGSLAFPSSESSRPLILIGPGTGIAPFRAFAQQREYQSSVNHSTTNLSPVFVYFGCRYQHKDHIFAEEWSKRVKDGVIQRYSVAFSRDSALSKERVELESNVFISGGNYVDSHLLADKILIAKSLLEDGGTIMIAGSNRTGMPKRVRDAIESILVSERNLTQEEAKTFIRRLEAERRFQVEVW